MGRKSHYQIKQMYFYQHIEMHKLLEYYCKNGEVYSLVHSKTECYYNIKRSFNKIFRTTPFMVGSIYQLL